MYSYFIAKTFETAAARLLRYPIEYDRISLESHLSLQVISGAVDAPSLFSEIVHSAPSTTRRLHPFEWETSGFITFTFAQSYPRLGHVRSLHRSRLENRRFLKLFSTRVRHIGSRRLSALADLQNL